MASVSVREPRISAALLLFPVSDCVYGHLLIRFSSSSSSSKLLSYLSTFVQEDLNNQDHTNSGSRVLANVAMGILL